MPNIKTMTFDLSQLADTISESVAAVLKERGLTLPADAIREIGRNAGQAVMCLEIEPCDSCGGVSQGHTCCPPSSDDIMLAMSGYKRVAKPGDGDHAIDVRITMITGHGEVYARRVTGSDPVICIGTVEEFGYCPKRGEVLAIPDDDYPEVDA